MYISKNPATEEIIEEHTTMEPGEVAGLLSDLWSGHLAWKKVSLARRLEHVAKLSFLIEEKREQLANIITREMGKTIRESLGEVDRLTLFCSHALERAEEILATRDIPNPLAPAHSQFDPLGVVFAITPWNVPIGTPFRTVLPALVGGNSVLVKPAPNVALSARILQELCLEAGFPENVFKVGLLSNELAEKVLVDSRIRKLSFVGSTAVGSHLASIAGKAVKPMLLELGGSDPMIVLDDADVEVAAKDAAQTRCNNAGQVCCASKRMIVTENVYEAFKEQFVMAMSHKNTGDPLDQATDYGPLARKDIRDRLTEQVMEARQRGVKVLLDGGAQDGKGYFFKPMVFESSDDGEFAAQEEFFGPVATLMRARDAKDAVRIANSSPYGLGGAVYSNNAAQIKEVAGTLESGFVYVNRTPGLHPYIPFGGVKMSGYGKDCGDDGYLEYVNKKSVVGISKADYEAD